MPAQPFTPPFYSTFNYRDSSNDFAGNLPKPVAESAYQGDWIVETIYKQEGKFRTEWTPVWSNYFDATITVTGVEEIADGYHEVSFELDEELARMDMTEINDEFDEWIIAKIYEQIGADPEEEIREIHFDFTYKGRYLNVTIS